MRIAIIGSGAMGSLFGGLLAEAGHDVVLYDVWEDHVKAIHRNGLQVSSPDGHTRTIEVEATTDPKDLKSPN